MLIYNQLIDELKSCRFIRYMCVGLSVLLAACSNGSSGSSTTTGNNSITSPSIAVANVYDNGGSVSICQIVESGISNCYIYNNASAISNDPVGLYFDDNNLYVANRGGNNLSICPIKNNQFQTCSLFSGNGTFNNPDSIKADAADNFLFISNRSGNNISKCSIIEGNVESCVLTTELTESGSLALNKPYGVTLDDNDNIYVANRSGNNVSICPLLESTTLICSNYNNNGNFQAPDGITYSKIHQMIYVANTGNGTVSYCNVSNGSITQCNNTDIAGFNSPSGIAYDKTNDMLYITNFYQNTVTVCPLTINGAVIANTCTTSAGLNSSGVNTFVSPVGIATYTK